MSLIYHLQYGGIKNVEADSQQIEDLESILFRVIGVNQRRHITGKVFVTLDYPADIEEIQNSLDDARLSFVELYHESSGILTNVAFVLRKSDTDIVEKIEKLKKK